MQFATFIDTLDTVILCTSSCLVLSHPDAALSSYRAADGAVQVQALQLIQLPYS